MKEWLETDGLGGYAMGTTSLRRTRRYHGLLLCARRPPAERVMLVSGLEAWVDVGGERFALSEQVYAPEIVHPRGSEAVVAFEAEPWPRWRFEPQPGLGIDWELSMVNGLPATLLRWRSDGARGARLSVRLLLSVRDFHCLAQKNDAFRFDPVCSGERVSFFPYPELPGVHVWFSGEYRHDPSWYERFVYTEERERGLDHLEDLASPGVFVWELDSGPAELVLAADLEPVRALGRRDACELASELRERERERRASFESPLARAADQYLVARPGGVGIVAGYPWFGEWGRDTFIALPGLCLPTGRSAEARAIVLAWAETVEDGLLPNRFVDDGSGAELNSVDASLWFVIAIGELERRGLLSDSERERLAAVVQRIVSAFLAGTRFSIRVDADGLVMAGAPGVQLTWMDAKVGSRVITPRSGKPVEIQALWVNALAIADRLGIGEAERALGRARASFGERFWCEERGHLHDVVDVDHVAGTADPALRPNQLFALGGLPIALFAGERARRAVDRCVQALWTPMGPRSLAPEHPSYVPHYRGGVLERDGAYHQGTVWPWLAGPLVRAWLRTREAPDEAARIEARERFVLPLLESVGALGIGHVSEIADADPPHAPRGCPFQAWSLAELIRLDEELGDQSKRRNPAPAAGRPPDGSGTSTTRRR